MGKINKIISKDEDEKPKKKKGRPSLLDLQKRSLKQQQKQQQQQLFIPNPNPNSHFPTPYSDDSSDNLKEKKLKFVLKLPNSNPNFTNSASDDSTTQHTNLNKRKINGSVIQEEKANYASKTRDDVSVLQIESVATTPLPDRKLLVFILDRLQKKDTYAVFSEPVDPKELPDYHEIIEHPMDFGTVRKNLMSGAYFTLEQIEKDVLLICSNAMRYNAPDTIYFRQARSIQELAKRDFENLKQDSDDNEPRPKVVRRGRPPKNLKKHLGGSSFERAGSEFSPDTTLATGGDNNVWSNTYDLRKGHHPEKSGSSDALGRPSNRSRQVGAYSNWPGDKYEGNDDFPASVLKGMSMKLGKKHFVLDENRRNTYKQSHSSFSGRDASVLTTFDGDKKQLIDVGVRMEYSFARSLARFAATLGPTAWKIASKKIEKALPAGMKFGPGWVGEHEYSSSPQVQLIASPPQSSLVQQPQSLAIMSSLATTANMVDSEVHKPLVRQESSDDSASYIHSNGNLPASTAVSSSSLVANISHEPAKEPGGTAQVSKCQGGFSSVDISAASIRPHSFQINHSWHKNGFSSGYLAPQSQMGKPVRSSESVRELNCEVPTTSGMLSMVSRSNNKQLMPADGAELEETKLAGSVSTPNSHASAESQAGARMPLGMEPSRREGLPQQQKPDSIPPDLNVRFQSPVSPGSTPQPDLVLQL